MHTPIPLVTSLFFPDCISFGLLVHLQKHKCPHHPHPQPASSAIRSSWFPRERQTGDTRASHKTFLDRVSTARSCSMKGNL